MSDTTNPARTLADRVGRVDPILYGQIFQQLIDAERALIGITTATGDPSDVRARRLARADGRSQGLAEALEVLSGITPAANRQRATEACAARSQRMRENIAAVLARRSA